MMAMASMRVGDTPPRKPDGLRYRLLDWDSRFFGYRIARIEGDRLDEAGMAAALAGCEAERIECLYFCCAADDDRSVQLAESRRFHLVDVRLDLACRLPAAPAETAVGLWLAQAADLASMRAIAADAYRDSRFWFDSHLRPQAAALYREWIARSCREETVWAIERDAAVQGFVTAAPESPAIARIGLLGVAAASRGAGIGGALIRAALQWGTEVGAGEVRVVTQGRNVAAQRLYQACGFRTQSVHLWYHKWFG
jgi:dTDP-4-amino-4,6-dideoxy-D-galactose acyltransferase